MNVDVKIWNEMKRVDAHARAARWYVAIQIKISTLLKILIPFFTALSLLFAGLEMKYYTIISAFLSFFIAVIKDFGNSIILSDKDINKLGDIGVDFCKYKADLENVYAKIQNKSLSPEDPSLLERSTEWSKEIAEKEMEMNKLIHWIPSWIKKRFVTEQTDELKLIFYKKENE